MFKFYRVLGENSVNPRRLPNTLVGGPDTLLLTSQSDHDWQSIMLIHLNPDSSRPDDIPFTDILSPSLPAQDKYSVCGVITLATIKSDKYASYGIKNSIEIKRLCLHQEDNCPLGSESMLIRKAITEARSIPGSYYIHIVVSNDNPFLRNILTLYGFKNPPSSSTSTSTSLSSDASPPIDSQSIFYKSLTENDITHVPLPLSNMYHQSLTTSATTTTTMIPMLTMTMMMSPPTTTTTTTTPSAAEIKRKRICSPVKLSFSDDKSTETTTTSSSSNNNNNSNTPPPAPAHIVNVVSTHHNTAAAASIQNQNQNQRRLQSRQLFTNTTATATTSATTTSTSYLSSSSSSSTSSTSNLSNVTAGFSTPIRNTTDHNTNVNNTTATTTGGGTTGVGNISSGRTISLASSSSTTISAVTSTSGGGISSGGIQSLRALIHSLSESPLKQRFLSNRISSTATVTSYDPSASYNDNTLSSLPKTTAVTLPSLARGSYAEIVAHLALVRRLRMSGGLPLCHQLKLRHLQLQAVLRGNKTIDYRVLATTNTDNQKHKENNHHDNNSGNTNINQHYRINDLILFVAEKELQGTIDIHKPKFLTNDATLCRIRLVQTYSTTYDMLVDCGIRNVCPGFHGSLEAAINYCETSVSTSSDITSSTSTSGATSNIATANTSTSSIHLNHIDNSCGNAKIDIEKDLKSSDDHMSSDSDPHLHGNRRRRRSINTNADTNTTTSTGTDRTTTRRSIKNNSNGSGRTSTSTTTGGGGSVYGLFIDVVSLNELSAWTGTGTII